MKYPRCHGRAMLFLYPCGTSCCRHSVIWCRTCSPQRHPCLNYPICPKGPGSQRNTCASTLRRLHGQPQVMSLESIQPRPRFFSGSFLYLTSALLSSPNKKLLQECLDNPVRSSEHILLPPSPYQGSHIMPSHDYLIPLKSIKGQESSPLSRKLTLRPYR